MASNNATWVPNTSVSVTASRRSSGSCVDSTISAALFNSHLELPGIMDKSFLLVGLDCLRQQPGGMKRRRDLCVLNRNVMKGRLRRICCGVAAGAVLLFCVPAPAAGQPPSDSTLKRGQYLATVGNCISCHTRPGAVPFSGGVLFETLFGKIYSSNITPDPATGIGRWSAGDLRQAMHEGIAAGGHRLFPAFPYTSFSKTTDADTDAIFTYLRTLTAVRYTPPSNGFLFSQRWALMFWNYLFFDEGRFSPSPTQSTEWNRGAYLVESLGHCGACHTPRNYLMAEEKGSAYQGGHFQDKVAQGKTRRWSAVNLTSAKSGLASWSVSDLEKYLQSGFSMRAGTFGPMNGVIVNSLRKMTPEDVHSMAVYLKSLPPREYTDEAGISPTQLTAGESIYKERCEKCHLASGRGGMLSAPPLAGSAVVQADDPASLINIILYGPETPEDVSFGAWETMKPYAEVLDDSQVAAVSNYIRGSWKNRGRPVTPKDAAEQR
jgi:alcohol dehydrogenase (quinone), cytochrome c subunit